MVESPASSDIFTSEESPLAHLRDLPNCVRRVDQCMLGAEIEDHPVTKSTELQSNAPMGEHIKCDGCHGHLQLRGPGPGGSRTAQAARYPARMCDLILEGIGTGVPEGGSSIPAPLPDL